MRFKIEFETDDPLEAVALADALQDLAIKAKSKKGLKAGANKRTEPPPFIVTNPKTGETIEGATKDKARADFAVDALISWIQVTESADELRRLLENNQQFIAGVATKNAQARLKTHIGRKDDEFRIENERKGDIVVEDFTDDNPPEFDELVTLFRELYDVSVESCDRVLKALGVPKLSELHSDLYSKAGNLIRSAMVAHRELEPAAD